MIKGNARFLAMQKKEIQDIKVLVVADDHRQRVAFSDTVRSCGFTLVGCMSPVKWREKSEQFNVVIDMWLIDSDYDESVAMAIAASKPAAVLVGFSQAPYLNEAQQYAKWQRKLKRKFAQLLALPDMIDAQADSKNAIATDWHYVVFLGASMGGPSAVKEFLDHVPVTLPVCILLAHHFNQAMIETLPRILNRHNDWRCEIITSSQRLQSGYCLIAPIDKQIVCDSAGRVILLEQSWSGEYKPAIGQILKNTSDVYGNELINIIFSGMGNDGSQYLDLIQDNSSQLWAQDPGLSACASQPQAIIDSGYCSFVGSPKELAQKLTDYISERTVEHSR